MHDELALQPGHLLTFGSPDANCNQMLELIARVAMCTSLLVIDAGNQFNAYRIARLLRRETVELTAALERIRLTRPFTVYQLDALFERPLAPIPVFVLDLLMLFYDENVSLVESRRLLERTLAHLSVMKQAAPVIVGARPPNRLMPDRLPLLHALVDASDLFLWQPSVDFSTRPATAVASPLLPGFIEE